MTVQAMANAFIRVSEKNETQQGEIIYTQDDILAQIKKLELISSGLRYYLIRHDADEEVSLTHWHILLRFKSTCRFETIKDFFPFGKIENPKNIKKCLQYLIHYNDLDKVQYDWDDIITNTEISALEKKSPLRDKLLNIKKLEELLQAIDLGYIKRNSMFDMVDMHFYIKYKKQIESAFEYVQLRRLSDVNRNVDVLFLQGKSGVGKTWFAKDWCEKHNLTYSLSSASEDFMQFYSDEDVLILDDLRDEIPYSHLLRLLDNNTNSGIKSRYKDKLFIGKFIIITSFKPLKDWYSNLSQETLVQLKRRVKHLFEFRQDKKIAYYYYDKEEQEYTLRSFLENECPFLDDDVVCPEMLLFPQTEEKKVSRETWQNVDSQIILPFD